MNPEEVKLQYQERLARYQAAISLCEPDRVPISAGSNYFAEVFAGFDKQRFVYDASCWMEADAKFAAEFPEVDNLRSGRMWGPHLDAVGWNLYKVPGRDISPDIQSQFVEGERMKADEYDLLIKDPVAFIFERVLPRSFDELKEPGSQRSYVAFLKSGMSFIMLGELMKQRSLNLQNELGMPLPCMGNMLAPFDYLADGLRGLTGIMLDLFRQPERILEACEALIPHVVNAALATADPLRRYPVHMPLHRGCHPFLSPKQFAEFYWPSLKKAMQMLIDSGLTLRIYLEGDWGPNWHHLREMPAGKIICDVDGPGDIFQAKKDIGDMHCLAGGIQDSTLILGSPDDVRKQVKKCCEELMGGGGYIINGGCGIPYDTKPENYRAMIDATLEYGRYKDSIDFEPYQSDQAPAGWQSPPKGVITPWQQKAAELGELTGREDLIQTGWEMLEHKAFNWFLTWLW